MADPVVDPQLTSRPAPEVPAGLEGLAERLDDPTPVCLALVMVEPSGDGPTEPGHEPEAGMTDAITDRLQQILREYDELLALPDGRLVALLPTLAGSATMADRLQRVFEALAEPYEIAGRAVPLQVKLGAAVREPGEPVAPFLARLVAAVQSAAGATGEGPVLG